MCFACQCDYLEHASPRAHLAVCQLVRKLSPDLRTYLDVDQPHVLQHLSKNETLLFVQLLDLICRRNIADCAEAGILG
jgi:hypothetical protein